MASFQQAVLLVVQLLALAVMIWFLIDIVIMMTWYMPYGLGRKSFDRMTAK
jgi:hypothetical protein